jgi:hypothetical protein
MLADVARAQLGGQSRSDARQKVVPPAERWIRQLGRLVSPAQPTIFSARAGPALSLPSLPPPPPSPASNVGRHVVDSDFSGRAKVRRPVRQRDHSLTLDCSIQLWKAGRSRSKLDQYRDRATDEAFGSLARCRAWGRNLYDHSHSRASDLCFSIDHELRRRCSRRARKSPRLLACWPRSWGPRPSALCQVC